MEDQDAVKQTRRIRVRRTVEEKRRIVEASFQAGMSVARAAQAAGVNANQVFQWRRDYRSGLLTEGGQSATSLVPVVVTETSFDTDAEPVIALPPAPRTPAPVIHIDFPGRAVIHVESGADAVLLRSILESLRK